MQSLEALCGSIITDEHGNPITTINSDCEGDSARPQARRDSHPDGRYATLHGASGNEHALPKKEGRQPPAKKLMGNEGPKSIFTKVIKGKPSKVLEEPKKQHALPDNIQIKMPPIKRIKQEKAKPSAIPDLPAAKKTRPANNLRRLLLSNNDPQPRSNKYYDEPRRSAAQVHEPSKMSDYRALREEGPPTPRSARNSVERNMMMPRRTYGFDT